VTRKSIELRPALETSAATHLTLYPVVTASSKTLVSPQGKQLGLVVDFAT
jgi:hypothetical protein